MKRKRKIEIVCIEPEKLFFVNRFNNFSDFQLSACKSLNVLIKFSKFFKNFYKFFGEITMVGTFCAKDSNRLLLSFLLVLINVNDLYT